MSRYDGRLELTWKNNHLRLLPHEDGRCSLAAWVATYDRRRPHAGLAGQTSMSVLVNKVDGNDN